MSSSRPFPAPDMAASLLDALEGHGQGLWDWNLAPGEIGRSADDRAALRTSASDTDGASSYLDWQARSEEHTSELQSLMRISYAVFCLKKKTVPHQAAHTHSPQHKHTQP